MLGCANIANEIDKIRRLTMSTLKDVRVGDSAIVTKINGEGPLRRRIMDMGVTKGTTIRVRKVAPLGDPIEVSVRGYELSLRKQDADMIDVDYICNKRTK